MFACVSWTGDFAPQVFAALPNQQLSCYFLPSTVVFNVPDGASFVDTRSKLGALAADNAAFHFSLALHVDESTFGGHPTYELPDNWKQILGT